MVRIVFILTNTLKVSVYYVILKENSKIIFNPCFFFTKHEPQVQLDLQKIINKPKGLIVVKDDQSLIGSMINKLDGQ